MQALKWDADDDDVTAFRAAFWGGGDPEYQGYGPGGYPGGYKRTQYNSHLSGLLLSSTVASSI